MQRFFSRIFLSVWIILIVTALLMLLLAGLLPTSNNDESPYDTQLVKLVADDLHHALAKQPSYAIEELVQRHVFDFERLLQIYVITPDGNEAFGRDLPLSVKLATNRLSQGDSAEIKNPQLIIYQDGLNGYLVVGLKRGYPIVRKLVQPGARALLVVVAIFVSAVISLLLTRFVLLPVRRVQLAGQQVVEGDLSVRVAHTVGDRKDDIAQLARDFDTMTERIEELLASQQRLMRDVSHELRSPLARMQALLSLARQRFVDESIVDRMELETERLNALIEQILTYSRMEAMDTVQAQTTELMDLIQTIADDAAIEGEASGKEVIVKGPSQCFMEIDATMMHSAIENIVRNAVCYTQDQSTVTLTVTDASDSVAVSIEDRGPGVPEALLSHLFDPFFQVDSSRPPEKRGSGVGLAIAKRAVVLHGGTIEANNRADDGLCVQLCIPKTSS